MSESRRPDFTLVLTTQDDQVTHRHKLECYKASQFPSNAFQTQRQYDDNGVTTFRVRHNGVWVPPGQRQLMSLSEILSLAESTVSRHLTHSDSGVTHG